MSNIDKQALRQTAEKAQEHGVFNMDIHSQTVLALLDELEAKDKAWAAQDDHINQQADRIESLERKNGDLGRALGVAEKRIAELEAQEVTAEIIDQTCLAASEIHNLGRGVSDDKAQFIIDRIRNYLEIGGQVQSHFSASSPKGE